MSIKKDILWRVGLIYLVVAIFAVLIVSKIIYLQVIDGDKWKEKSNNTRIKKMKILPHRGDIYASDMKLLACSAPYYEIRIDTKTPSLTDEVFYGNIDSLALQLAVLFKDRSKAQYKEQIINARKQGNRYYLVKKNVNYLQLQQVKKFPIFRRGQYKGGLIVNQENVRRRPLKSLAARTIGYTSKSDRGNIVGIEGAYDKYLKGVEGEKRVQKLAGNVWMPLDEAGEIEPKDGNSVVTTIDINLQDVAERALLRQLMLHKAHHGTVVLMEVKTGDVKAIVNLTKTSRGYGEIYNYAVGESTEPGSTFKLPAILTVIEDGIFNLEDTINTGNGIFKYYDHIVRDDNHMHGGHGAISVKDVFRLSSNVGMAKIITGAYKEKPQRFIDRLYGMNLNEKLGVDIKGEGKPMIKYPGDKYWSGVSLATMSYGYEVRLTPLQILAFYNAIANHGKLVKPRFVTKIIDHGNNIETFPVEVLNPSICSNATINKLRIMLESVVEKGTAQNLKSSHLKIAGKTGTTQIYNKEYGYKMGSKVSYQASFAGYFPADNPTYSCIVVVNSPSNDIYHGNMVAGPVFLEIANKIYATNIDLQRPLNNKSDIAGNMMPYSKNGYQYDYFKVFEDLGIPVKTTSKNAKWVRTEKKADYVKLLSHPVQGKTSTIPNVVSMGLKDAIYLLENLGIKVVVNGRGSIQGQSIPPGTPVAKGQSIELEMSFKSI